VDGIIDLQNRVFIRELVHLVVGKHEASCRSFLIIANISIESDIRMKIDRKDSETGAAAHKNSRKRPAETAPPPIKYSTTSPGAASNGI
jgi:hypothetical protein